MATHIVIGNGPCSSEAVTASLKDVIAEGDALALAWAGVNIPESVEAVYKFAFDTEMALTVFYSEGQTVHSMVRDRDHVSVVKVRDTRESLLKAVDGKVLVLWDDDEDYINYVFDTRPEAEVLELSNGLAPIIGIVEEPSNEPEVVEEEDDEQVTPMTRDELESATAFVVKRYGQRMGCKSNTKSGIIEELFPAQSRGRSDNSDLIALIDGIVADIDGDTLEWNMVKTLLGEARVWAKRAT